MDCFLLQESLRLSIAVPRHGLPADVVLPSFYLYPPPKIVLEVTGELHELADFRAWRVIVGHLSRAAKEFKTTHPGRKMEVEIAASRWNGDFKHMFVEWCTCEEGMLGLGEDANVVITGEEV